MNNETQDIMTIEEVAAMLRVPVSSVYRLARECKIPAQKVGRHWRFHRPTLLKWVAGEWERKGSVSASEGKNS